MAAMAPIGRGWALGDGGVGREVDVEEGMVVEFDVGEFWERKGGVSWNLKGDNGWYLAHRWATGCAGSAATRERRRRILKSRGIVGAS